MFSPQPAKAINRMPAKIVFIPFISVVFEQR